MKKNAIIVVPHEDDMEILGFHPVAYLIEKGFHIIEIVMTDGRFGTKNAAFSGDRLKRIRDKEIRCAAKSYGKDENGNDHVELVLMGYCDGFLPFDKRSVGKLQKKIMEYNPVITIGMDPFLAVDYHHDHINTGRNYYFALKTMVAESRPKYMYFIQSFKNNEHVGLGSFKLQEKALSCHRSQLAPLNIRLITRITKFLYHLLSFKSRVKPMCGIRKVEFDIKKNSLSGLRDRIAYSLMINSVQTTKQHYTEMYKPLPKIGDGRDAIDPRDFDMDAAKKLSRQYFGKDVDWNPHGINI